jgi:diketogulonate reductase-like aldo/keto reductase
MESRQLSDGRKIPVLALGVAQIRKGRQCVNAVRWALELGYRHIDTAQLYGNEKSVGRAVRDSSVPREELFITTKFAPRRRDPVAEAERSLRRLDIDYVDLYLVHWPQRGATQAWPGMEKTLQLGYARSIGVSNYGVGEMDQVVRSAEIPPVVNQVQFSPFEYQRALLDAAIRHHIVVEAYSPLGSGRHLADRHVGEVASRVGRSPAQVLLRWCLQRNTVVLPKSTHRDRIEENARIFDFELSDYDLAELDRLDRTGGTGEAG